MPSPFQIVGTVKFCTSAALKTKRQKKNMEKEQYCCVKARFPCMFEGTKSGMP